MEAILDLLTHSDSIIILVHSHADLDSVGSAVGLATTLDSTVDIAKPSTLQSDAASLLEKTAVVSDPDLESYDLQIVVDAPSRQRISPLDPTDNEVPLLLIDHHEPDDLQRHATQHYVDTEAPATALLVAELLEDCRWELSSTAAEALVAGTLDDTGFRAVLMPDAQERTLDLLERVDHDSGRLVDLWETEPSWSERMATAKAVVRANGYKAGQTIVLVSRVGGEETAAAHALLDGNADIGVIISDRGNRTRVIVRTADSMIGELSLPADVLRPLAEEFGGHGGGHATAGIAKLDEGSPETIEESILEQIESALGMQFGTFS